MRNKQYNFNFAIFVLVLTLSLIVVVFGDKNKDETEVVRAEVQHSEFYDVLLVLLNPYANNAINKLYPNRSYALWNAEILEVKRLTGGFSQYDFTVKVKYDTYTGPLNPPEGPVTLTFHVTLDGVSVTRIQK
ncbi:DUF3888 domain-containing protein [Viridibacillus arvi]|uniref:DUF3888 domain-containing protein n=1 Tax=Viridibacillus arvi TaxID=263475 RepID=UPI00187B4478|nr:DUF3888 domain-containing protein [Viridibacillus sp. JNUCC-6]QOV12131.1 DUF3888 domain-containing protein [Viridibacillus sp. JNUCC-6]